MKELWTTVHGGWGDAIASYGNIRALLTERQANQANVVFFGIDSDIITFLKSQKGIGKVRHLQITDKTQYYEYSVMGILDFPLFTRMTGLHDQIPDLIPTHISDFYQSKNQTVCNRYFDAVLPPPVFDWTEVLPKEPFILFQPYSCYSCKQSEHWPFWMEALDFVLNNTTLKVVLIGQLKSMYDDQFIFPWVEHRNLVNLVGQTSSMIDVFHIMAKAEGVISTSNGLSMWSIVTNKPSLVVCNQIIQNSPVKYYYNWINHSPNLLLDHETEIDTFSLAAKNFVERLQ